MENKFKYLKTPDTQDLHFLNLCVHNKYVKNTHPKTLILIGILVTLAVVLLGIAIRLTGTPENRIPGTVEQTPTPTVAKTSLIMFSPATLTVPSASRSGNVEVMVDTSGSPITGAQVEITYDPAIITNVEVESPDPSNSLFGAPGTYTNLFTDTTTPGKITFARAIALNGQEINGTGSIGKISFTIAPTATGSTEMTFGPDTVVTSTSTTESVLNSTTPLRITLQ